MVTLLAFVAYASSLFIVYHTGLAFGVVSGRMPWLLVGILAAPFLYLLTRLYTKRGKPWPGLSGLFFAAYIFFNFFILVSWPGIFRDLPLKSVIGAQRGNLNRARESLLTYVQANNAAPADLSAVLPVMPALKLPLTPHKTGSEVRISTFADIQDSGQWLYVADSSAPALLIDCTHRNHRGNPWSSF